VPSSPMVVTRGVEGLRIARRARRSGVRGVRAPVDGDPHVSVRDAARAEEALQSGLRDPDLRRLVRQAADPFGASDGRLGLGGLNTGRVRGLNADQGDQEGGHDRRAPHVSACPRGPAVRRTVDSGIGAGSVAEATAPFGGGQTVTTRTMPSNPTKSVGFRV
jgi:hypothetical protein